MTKAFSTKRALLASVLSLLLCVSMLIGSTFAWFTDTDSAATSNIVSGTLDVEIIDADGKEKTDELKFLDQNNASPKYWEPGATYHTEQFAIKNIGNLNLKFKLDIKGAKISEGKLNEVIAFVLVEVNSDGTTANEYPIKNTGANNTVLMKDITLAAEAQSNYFYIKATMSSDAGNDYQKLTLNGLNIVVYATQETGEFDINGDDYDQDADYDDDVLLVKNAEEFINAFATFEEGKTISLTADIDMTGKTWTPVMNKGFVLKGNGHTITGLNGPLVGTTAAKEYTVKDITFKTLTIDGVYGDIAIGGVIAYADTCAYINMENVTIDGATITGAEYVGGFVGYTSGYGVDTNGPVNASHNFTNCTIKNATLTSSTDGSVGGLIGHAGSNAATTTRINSFNYSGLSMAQTNANRPEKTGNMIGTANIGIVYITDADINVTYDIGRFVPNTTGKLYINDAEQVAFSNDAADPIVKIETIAPGEQAQTNLNNAIANAGTEGETVLALPSGTYTLPTIGSAQVPNAKEITISGSKDTVIDMSKAVTTADCKLAFEGVTVQYPASASYTGMQHSAKVVYKDCTISGQQTMYAPEVEFINCTFENSANAYCVWTYGASKATFTDCTFNTAGKAVLVYNETKDANFVADISFNNCTFNDDETITMTKAAVETGVANLSDPNNNSSAAVETETSNKYNITFTNCEVNGFAESPEGIDTNSTFFANKNSMNKDHLNVVINGVDVY